MNQFIFKIAIPLAYCSTDRVVGPTEELTRMLSALSLTVHTEELKLAEIPLIFQSKKAHNSRLPKMIENYFNKKNIIYDVEGFRLLENCFGCPEQLAYNSLEMDCYFTLSDSDIANRISELKTERRRR